MILEFSYVGLERFRPGVFSLVTPFLLLHLGCWSTLHSAVKENVINSFHQDLIWEAKAIAVKEAGQPLLCESLICCSVDLVPSWFSSGSGIFINRRLVHGIRHLDGYLGHYRIMAAEVDRLSAQCA